MTDLAIHTTDLGGACSTEGCNPRPVCQAFNNLILNIACDLMPEGWDVIENAPDTLDDAIAYYEKHGRVAVDVESKHGCTIGDPKVHYAFRAWHDLIHILYPEEATFDLKGERWAADRHREEIFKRLGYTQEAIWFGALVEIEIVAQNAYMLRTGNWPRDPRAFAERWLEDRSFTQPGRIARPVADAA